MTACRGLLGVTKCAWPFRLSVPHRPASNPRIEPNGYVAAAHFAVMATNLSMGFALKVEPDAFLVVPFRDRHELVGHVPTSEKSFGEAAGLPGDKRPAFFFPASRCLIRLVRRVSDVDQTGNGHRYVLHMNRSGFAGGCLV